MDMMQNKEIMPDMKQIEEYITGEAKLRWHNLISQIETSFQAKPKIAYSVCAAKPGWNIKYKKSGKALCTLYPEQEGFVVLIVLGLKDMDLFDTVRQGYTEYINKLYDGVKPFNGTKWLMIDVTDQRISDDVLKLMHLKRDVAKNK